MIKLKTVDDGTILPVRAQPGASRDGIRGWQDGLLRVSVTQVAEQGTANKYPHSERESGPKTLGFKQIRFTRSAESYNVLERCASRRPGPGQWLPECG